MALNAERQSSTNHSMVLSKEDSSQSIDESSFEKDYEILKEYEKLKTELNLQGKELSSIKENNKNYITINESLRSQIKQLQKNVIDSNILLKKTQNITTKQIKQLSENKSRTIEFQAKKYLSSIFTKNQLDLMMKKKKKVHWTKDEISNAFTLRYFSKRAYIYVKNKLNYPLPGW